MSEPREIRVVTFDNQVELDFRPVMEDVNVTEETGERKLDPKGSTAAMPASSSDTESSESIKTDQLPPAMHPSMPRVPAAPKSPATPAQTPAAKASGAPK